MTSAVLYVNPSSGGGKPLTLLPLAERVIRDTGWDLHVVTDPDRASALNKLDSLLRDTDCVVVIGGDGSIHDVVSVMIATNSAATLRVIPAGTGNDFVASVGIPRDAEAAIRKLSGVSTEVRIDVGRARWLEDNGEYTDIFVNACGIGIDAEVAGIARKYKRLGRFSYVAAALEALTSAHSRMGRIVLDGVEVYTGEYHMVTIANGKFVGGGFVISNDASVTDGHLDAAVVTPASYFELLRLLAKARTSLATGSPALKKWRGEALTVVDEIGAPLHLDGEVVATAVVQLTVEIMPASLKLMLPAE